MKLFVIAAIIAVSNAARLEHLEQQQQQLRQYLPPNQGFGPSAPGSFGNNFGVAGAGQPDLNARGAFPSTSNQYLPPDHGPNGLASPGSPDFTGSINGFGAAPSQQFGQASPNQFGQDSATLGSSPVGAQAGQPQPFGAINQYTAPQSSQDIPQQSFDEKTGYHY